MRGAGERHEDVLLGAVAGGQHADVARRAREQCRDDLVLDQRGRRVDENEIDVLLGSEPYEVAAGVGRAERGSARGEPAREQALPRLVEEGGCGSEVAGRVERACEDHLARRISSQRGRELDK